MPDSEPDQPPPPPPEPEGAIVPSPIQSAKDTMAERGLFPGLLGGGDDEDGERPPEPPRGRGKKKMRSEMGFLEHLEELRMTIIKSLFAIFIGMGVMGIFVVKILNILTIPLTIALGPEKASATLIAPLEPMGNVSLVISVTIYGGVILALPLVAYFVAQFIAPGLTFRERGMLRPALLAALGLFFVGVLSCFFILLPAGLLFSYKLGEMLSYTNKWTANSYNSLVVWATLATGLVFEFPLILVIMQMLGIISPDTLRGGRRYAVVIIALVGGFLAPSPDPGSMITMMVPMLLLYEGAIIIGSRLRKRRLAAQAEEAAKTAG